MLLILVQTARGTGVESLDRARADYERDLESIQTAFRERRLAMPRIQAAALRQLERQYQQAGDLNALLAVQNELSRFLLDPRGPSVPDILAPPDLARQAAAYKTRFRELAEERDRGVRAVHEQYRDALQVLQVALTRQGRIEDAKRVMQTLAGLDASIVATLPAVAPAPAAQVAPASAARVAPAPAAWVPPPAKKTDGIDDLFGNWAE